MALVLVVEDDLDIAETLELYLRNDRHRTERARAESEKRPTRALIARLRARASVVGTMVSRVCIVPPLYL